MNQMIIQDVIVNLYITVVNKITIDIENIILETNIHQKIKEILDHLLFIMNKEPDLNFLDEDNIKVKINTKVYFFIP